VEVLTLGEAEELTLGEVEGEIDLLREGLTDELSDCEVLKLGEAEELTDGEVDGLIEADLLKLVEAE